MSPLPALALFSVFATLVLALPVGAIRFSDRGGVDGIDLASLPENLAVPLRNADQHSRWTRSTAVLAAFAAAIVVSLASPRSGWWDSPCSCSGSAAVPSSRRRRAPPSWRRAESATTCHDGPRSSRSVS